MERITSLEELKRNIEEEKLIVTYYLGNSCGACNVIKMKVKEIVKDFNGVALCEIDGVKSPEIAASFNVFALPLLILYCEGKEVVRVGRYFNEEEFKDTLSRMYNIIF